MKKLILFCSLVIVVLAAYASTVNRDLSTIKSPSTYFKEGATVQGVKVAFDNDVNDATVSVGDVIGKLREVVIDSNGTDTSYKVYLKDNVRTLWSKTDCTSATDPYQLPITMTDGTNVFCDVPMSDTLSVQIKDANDATLDDLDIYVYYER